MPKTLILLSLNKSYENEKIKISPIGDFEGIDGRRYHLNAQEVLASMKKLCVDIVLDENHEDNRACGWFDLNSLEIKEDGIYAALSLTKEGQELVLNRSYRYLSPAYVIFGEKAGALQIERIASVGLVNRPNLLSQALNNESNTKGEKMDKELEELKAQLVALKAENEALQAKVKDLQAQIDAKDEEVSKIAQEAKNSLIDKAIESKELLPKRKEAALALNGQDLSNFLEVCKAEAEKELQHNKAALNEPNEQIDENIKAQLEL